MDRRGEFAYHPPEMKKTALLLAALGAVTLAVYWPVTGHEFVAYDDDKNISLYP